MSIILEGRNLSKCFGSLQAVQNLSLTIEQAECFALLGPNGAGKTTTLEMLEGLLNPDSGQIKIFSLDLVQHRRQVLQNVGVLLQETHLYKKLTVKETLELFASFFKTRLNIDELLAKLNLGEKTTSRLEHLSGGQKQRVYLCCALINDPQLLILDEPTTGLDPQARRTIWDLLLKLKSEHKSILLTTHYMEEAEYLADRVAIIDHGKIIAQGHPKTLIRDICGEQVLIFSFKDDTLNNEQSLEKIRKYATWLAGLQLKNRIFEIISVNALDHVQELKQISAQLNYELAFLQIRSCTLEDVFLKLTGRSIRDD